MTEETTTTTQAGTYLVFHGKRDAGAPELFEDAWYFEPNGPHGADDVFSQPYQTRDAALNAAEDYESIG